MTVDISTDFLLIDNLLSGTYTDYVTGTVTTLTNCIQQLPAIDSPNMIGEVVVPGTTARFAVPRTSLASFPASNSRLVVSSKNWRILACALQVINQTYVMACSIEADVRLA